MGWDADEIIYCVILFYGGLALDLVDWPKYCPSVLDTVGWVIWPVKIVPNMTYNVFGGTLNPTLLLLLCTSLHFFPIQNDVKWFGLFPKDAEVQNKEIESQPGNRGLQKSSDVQNTPKKYFENTK